MIEPMSGIHDDSQPAHRLAGSRKGTLALIIAGDGDGFTRASRTINQQTEITKRLGLRPPDHLLAQGLGVGQHQGPVHAGIHDQDDTIYFHRFFPGEFDPGLGIAGRGHPAVRARAGQIGPHPHRSVLAARFTIEDALGPALALFRRGRNARPVGEVFFCGQL